MRKIGAATWTGAACLCAAVALTAGAGPAWATVRPAGGLDRRGRGRAGRASSGSACRSRSPAIRSGGWTSSRGTSCCAIPARCPARCAAGRRSRPGPVTGGPCRWRCATPRSATSPRCPRGRSSSLPGMPPWSPRCPRTNCPTAPSPGRSPCGCPALAAPSPCPRRTGSSSPAWAGRSRCPRSIRSPRWSGTSRPWAPPPCRRRSPRPPPPSRPPAGPRLCGRASPPRSGPAARLPRGAAAAHHRAGVHAGRGLAHGAAGRGGRAEPGREGVLLARRGPGGAAGDHHLRAGRRPAAGPDAAARHVGLGRGGRGGHRDLPAADGRAGLPRAAGRSAPACGSPSPRRCGSAASPRILPFLPASPAGTALAVTRAAVTR